MKDREYIEEITDPVTGEVVTLRAATEAELDAAVAERFGIDREDREAGSLDLQAPMTLALSGRQSPGVGQVYL